MANENYPLLFFPAPAQADRNKLGGGGSPPHFPGIGRQRARIAPQLELVPLTLGQVLYESGTKMRHVYFPTTAIVSLL